MNNDDPMLNPDPAVREQYKSDLKRLIDQAVADDAPERKFWASQRSVGNTTIIGAAGFGDGPYAVDTPQ